jgi:hypothetical protein
VKHAPISTVSFLLQHPSNEQNNTAESTWYSLQTIDAAILVHAILPPNVTYHAIRNAIEVCPACQKTPMIKSNIVYFNWA